MKKLSKGIFLQACGLFTMAATHYRKAQQFENELTALLGTEGGGHLFDAMVDGGDEKQFEIALKADGFELARPPRRKRALK